MISTAFFIDEEERKRMGRLIEIERMKQGITQEDFAQKCGISLSLFNRIEKGKFNVRLDTLNQIAIALGYKIGFVKEPIVNNGQ